MDENNIIRFAVYKLVIDTRMNELRSPTECPLEFQRVNYVQGSGQTDVMKRPNSFRLAGKGGRNALGNVMTMQNKSLLSNNQLLPQHKTTTEDRGDIELKKKQLMIKKKNLTEQRE